MVGPYTCTSSIGVVNVEVPRKYMVGRSFRKGSRNMGDSFIGVN